MTHLRTMKTEYTERSIQTIRIHEHDNKDM